MVTVVIRASPYFELGCTQVITAFAKLVALLAYMLMFGASNTYSHERITAKIEVHYSRAKIA